MHNILILSVLIVGVIIYLLPDKQKTNKRLCIWGGINLFFYGALRSISTGTDIPTYSRTYLSLPYMTFKDIFSSKTIVSRDPFFYVFLKVLSTINSNPQFMLVITSAIVAVCFSIFVYKNSVNPILSFIMFIGLRYYSFTLSGLRQAIAWSIIMLSYEFIKGKNLFKFLITVLIASLFHKSAIVFIFAYPLSKIKEIEKVSIVVIFGVLFNFVSNHLIVRTLVEMPLLYQYQSYVYREEVATTGLTTLIIYTCILAFVFIMRKQILYENNNVHIMYNLCIVGLAITTLVFRYANIFRIGYYFIFPIVLLLPSAINGSFNKEAKMGMNFITISLLVIQFICIGPGAGLDNYQFFWK